MKRIVILTIYLCAFMGVLSQSTESDELSLIETLKARVSLESDPHELAKLFFEITEDYYPFDFDSSLYYAQLYLHSSIAAGDSLWMADAYGYIAHIYDQHGDLGLAKEYFRRSLEAYADLDEPYSIAACYNNLGYVVSYGLDQAGALTYFLKSMKIAESLQDSGLLADAYCNVAYFYERLKDYKTAFEYYKAELKLDILLGDSSYIAMSYSNMANIYLLLGKDQEAEEMIAKGKQYISSHHIPYDKVYLYSTFSDTYLEWGKADSARRYIELSEDILDEYDFILIDAFIMRQKGFLCYLEKDYANCMKFLDESIRIYESIGSEEALSRIYLKRAEVYARMNMHEAAYLSQVKANEIYESLKYGDVAGILSKHEQEKLEKQRIDYANIRYKANLKSAFITIILLLVLALSVICSLFIIRKKNRGLNAKNSLIKKQKELLEKHIDKLEISEKQLKELNATKDKFFSIIAHDLKSPLSAIMGISDLYLTEKEWTNKEDILPILESINSSSYFGVSLLDNLLEWARSQSGVMTPKPAKLNMDPILGKLEADFSAIAKGKRITLEFPHESLPAVYADENMVSTVMRNLIHNSIKFSHASGVVRVSTYRKDDYLVTSIEDQGIGINKKELAKLFAIDSVVRKVGTNNEQGSGLGLILCKEFVEKNQGMIWAEGEEQKGCKFSFTLPLFDESNSSN